MCCLKLTFCWFLGERNFPVVECFTHEHEINIFELMCSVKVTFCWFLSEINILAIMHQGEINILTIFDLKSTKLSSYVA